MLRAATLLSPGESLRAIEAAEGAEHWRNINARTLRQKDWHTLARAFLAGERPAPSGSTEGANDVGANRRRKSLR
jgi:hypothetical protein